MPLRKTRTQLLLLQLAGLVLLLVLISLGAYTLMRHQLTARMEQDLRTMARAVTFSVENEGTGIDFHESLYLSDRPGNVDLEATSSVQWLDPSGNVLARRGQIPMPAQPLADKSLVYSPEACSYTLSAANAQGIYGYARVATSLQPLHQQLSQLVELLAVTGGVTLLLTSLLSWWWTGRVLAPVQQAYQDLSLFTGSVSHELRSPLTAMLTQCQSLLRHYDRLEAAEIREGLQELSESSSDMARLVNDLLLLAQARRQQTQLEPVSVPELLKSFPQVQADGPEAKVLAHRPYLQIILSNLIDNAIHYSETGSPVQVRWKRRGRQLEIVVSDHGPGLSAEACARVFEPFWRAEQSRARHAGGAGLGLAIAHTMAQAQSGHLSVTSQPGQGSQFRLLLPLDADSSGTAAP